VLGELLSTNDALLRLFYLSRGFSFQAQFLPTCFFFMAMCCMLDSFAVLFDKADYFLLQLILKKNDVCISCVALHLVFEYILCRLPSEIVDILFRA
jgi:hypothetical protein